MKNDRKDTKATLCHGNTLTNEVQYTYCYLCWYITRDETIWIYIDVISIRRAMIHILPKRDISRYDPDIRNQEKSLRCHCCFSIRPV